MKQNEKKDTKINQILSVVEVDGEWIPIEECAYIEFCDTPDAKTVKFEYNGKKYRSMIKTTIF